MSNRLEEIVVVIVKIVLMVMFTFRINIVDIDVTNYPGYLFTKSVAFISPLLTTLLVLAVFLASIQVIFGHFSGQ